MKLTILRLLVIALSCICAVVLIANLRAPKAAANGKDFAPLYDSLGMPQPAQTPAPAAQEVCDRLVASGVTSVLNFAPTVLTVPDFVDVRKVDLSIELQILSYYQQRRAGASEIGAAMSELASV